MRGLWAPFHGIDEALAAIGDVEVSDGWMKKAPFGETVSGFPAGYDELLTYDVIILANMGGGQMLNDLSQEMLADYVRAGGGLLMLSGDRTYAQADFKNPKFLDVLPATFGEYGDYGRLPQPSPLKATARHEVLAGVHLPPREVVLYAHNVTARPNAETVLSLAGGRPALLTSTTGRGRVALVAALPFGEAPEGSMLYFRSGQWRELMGNVLKWLARR
jgi:uncharacterized membrane protein